MSRPTAPATDTCPTCRTTVRLNVNGDLRRHKRDGERCVGGETVQHLALGWSRPPLSLNDRHHWATKARLTRDVRATVALLARKLTPVETATVTLHYRPRDKRRRDADNLMATIKPCLDGLRDAGVIRDDSADLVVPQVRIHQPEAGMPGGMWLSIREGL